MPLNMLQGRVIFDVFVHRGDSDDAFLIDCDATLAATLLRHIAIFKLRSKVRALVHTSTLSNTV